MKMIPGELCLFLSLIVLASFYSCTNTQKNQRSERSVEQIMPFEGLRIEADNPRIQYTGRIDFSNPQEPAFSYPGTRIRARFSGSSIAVSLNDTTGNDYFAISIDGMDYPVLKTESHTETFYIADKLEGESHIIELVKRTESLCGVASFTGFTLEKGASLLPLEPIPDKRIEFVGDSITCGYGNLVSTDRPDDYPFSPENEDNTRAWGAVAASELTASYISTSYSGRGMYSNLDGNKDLTMPKVYKDVYPDLPGRKTWDPAAWEPRIIVINLGTNDYSWEGFQQGLDPDDFDKLFISTYKAFIDELRLIHGEDVHILCVIGPMMNNFYPPGRNALTRIRQGVSTMVKQFREAGDESIHFLELPSQQSPFGEDWHPTAATHYKMGLILAEFIRVNVEGWND